MQIDDRKAFYAEKETKDKKWAEEKAIEKKIRDDKKKIEDQKRAEDEASAARANEGSDSDNDNKEVVNVKQGTKKAGDLKIKQITI